MRNSSVQTVHSVLVLRKARQYGGTARRTTADRREGARKDETPLRQRVDVGRLDVRIAVDWSLEAGIVQKKKENVLLR